MKDTELKAYHGNKKLRYANGISKLSGINHPRRQRLRVSCAKRFASDFRFGTASGHDILDQHGTASPSSTGISPTDSGNSGRKEERGRRERGNSERRYREREGGPSRGRKEFNRCANLLDRNFRAAATTIPANDKFSGTERVTLTAESRREDALRRGTFDFIGRARYIISTGE